MSKAKNFCSTTVTPIVSVLPNDYSLMVNLPEINEVAVKGQLTSKMLNLLSSKADDYKQISLLEGNSDGHCIVVLGESEPMKIPISELSSAINSSGGFETSNELSEDMPIGAYAFILKE